MFPNPLVEEAVDVTHNIVELWRLFVRRFPVLSMYRPVWNDRMVAETIRLPLSVHT